MLPQISLKRGVFSEKSRFSRRENANFGEEIPSDFLPVKKETKKKQENKKKREKHEKEKPKLLYSNDGTVFGN